MDLESYWGVGPKTRATLEDSLGAGAAVEAIESGDLRALVDAGLRRSRATRIVRRNRPTAQMDLLATRDAREVYNDVLDRATEYAVNRTAANEIRTLTPLSDRDAMRDRLDAVERGRRTWAGLDEAGRTAVVDAFRGYDDAAGDRVGAAEVVVTVHEADLSGPSFEPLLDLDPAALTDAAAALETLSGGRLGRGADDQLDRLRDAREAVETMAGNADALVEELQSGGVRDATAFRESFVDHLRTELAIDVSAIRESLADDAQDATVFVTESLSALSERLATRIEDRTTEVRTDLEADVDAAGEDLDRAATAVTQAARELSLGRFAEAFALTRPTYATDGSTLAVEAGRNLSLLSADESVQPVTYALGTHDFAPPSGHQVSVLTGANSGGKTTLLETLCQVAILAHIGLPVPADEARVATCDRLVFHRRHASFNAGVLESTLQSVVPPLVSGDRTVMLVDEFEAITEPGRAADLLHGLVRLTVDQGALGTFVTHLADDLEPLPDAARTDGIFADGLTDDLDLEVDYQPRFETVGRSTPEFIVSRLLADADDPAQQAGFRTLAEAMGTESVQRTLSDAQWSDVSGE